jgi:Protein of unknown function (DUF3830)
VGSAVKLRVELPALGVEAEVTLLADAAPRVCRAIYDSLESPLVARTAHACFDGHEVFCFLPAFPEPPPIENRTMRPYPGDVMFFYAGPNEFACMAEDRLSGGSGAVHELAFMYGEVDLRHFWEEGVHGSLVGRVTAGLDAFAAACRRTLDEGRTPLRLSRAE